MSDRKDSLWDEERAERYIKLYGDPRTKMGTQSLLCKNAADLIVGETVLDFGCGMGHIIPHLEFPDEYVGLDFSKTMLDYLENFFLGVTTIHADSTQPTKQFIETLESQGLPSLYHTTMSTSLIIHLPTVPMVKQLLKNMWFLCEKAMVFCVETASNRKVVREDGLTLRNISVDNVYAMLKELGVDSSKIQHMHQKSTYLQYSTIYPLEEQVFQADPPKLYTRTTLFIAQK